MILGVDKIVGRAAWAADRYRVGFAQVQSELERWNQLSSTARLSGWYERLVPLLNDSVYLASNRSDWRYAAQAPDFDAFTSRWRAIRPLEKDDLRVALHPSRIAPLMRVATVANSSGGSTGEPTQFLTTRASLRRRSALHMYVRQNFGWYPPLPLVAVWGAERDVQKADGLRSRFANGVRGISLVDGYRIDDGTVCRFLEVVRGRAFAMYGFPSLLAELARRLPQQGDDGAICPVAVWSGGETITALQQRAVRAAFGSGIKNFYGGREVGPIAFEEVQGAMRVLEPFILVEVVDDDGKYVAPGDIGEVLVTGTFPGGTPFVRYRIGDLAVPTSSTDLGVEHLKHVVGRTGELIRAQDGSLVSPLFFNHLFKDVSGIAAFQVIIDESRQCKAVRYVGNIESDDAQRVKEAIGRLLGVAVRLEGVSSLAKSGSGKLSQVVMDDDAKGLGAHFA